MTVAGLLGGFPVEAVPDGRVLAPHHVFAVLVAAFVCWRVGDNYPRREPGVTLLGSVGAAAAFVLVWPLYPVTGAVLTLAGLLAVLVRPLYAWGIYPRRWRAVASGAALVALDDWVSHALHPETPLDWVWMHYIAPFIA